MKQIKKIIAGISAATLCLVIGAEVVPADILQRLTSRAEEYNGFEYTIETNWNDEEYASITGYSGSETDITIPNEIDGTAVGYFDLSGNENITSVVISDGIQELYNSYLQDCINLETVTLPSDITYYYGYMFQGDSNLREINVAEGNETYFSVDGILYANSIDYQYDEETESYTEYPVINCIECPEGKEGDVFIPENTKNIINYAFQNCTKITSLNIPGSVKYIGYYFGRGCSSLTDINIAEDNGRYFSDNGVLYGTYENWQYNSDTLITGTAILVYPEGREPESYSVLDGTLAIGGMAFENTKITSLNIPESVTILDGSSIFDNCTYLEEINYNGTPEIASKYCLYNYESENIPPVFANAPNGIIYLGNTLIGSSGTTPEYIVVKDGTARIESYAFSGNENIKTITVPASVEYIGTGAFDCPNLTAINVESKNPVYSSTDGVLFKENGKALIQYPASKTNTSYSIPEGVTAIYAEAFEGCNSIAEINIPDSVESIGYRAFAYCTNLKTVNMPVQLKEMGYEAFAYCSSLESITIPFGISDLNYCFDYCESLKTIDLPETISSLYWSANYSSSIEKIIIRNPDCSVSGFSNMPAGITIFGYDNSEVQKSAESNNINFQSLGEYHPIIKLGDTNEDGKATIADAVLIMQSLSNPDEYTISEQGQLNGDVLDAGGGITTQDALAIQMVDIQILTIEELPITSEELAEKLSQNEE